MQDNLLGNKETSRGKRITYVLMMLAGVVFLAASSAFIAFFTKAKTGSCCLQTTCDVNQLDEPLPRGRENMCVVTQEEATLMGCPNYYNISRSCSVTNNNVCTHNPAFILAIVLTVAGLLAGVILIVTSIVGLKLLGGYDPNICPMIGGKTFGVILSIVCVIIGGMTLYRLYDKPFSTSIARECQHHSSGKHSRCLSYRTATFANCPWTSGPANMFSWISDSDRVEIPTVVLVAVFAGFLLIGSVSIACLVTKATGFCECCLCCECCCAPLRERHERRQMQPPETTDYLYQGVGTTEKEIQYPSAVGADHEYF